MGTTAILELPLHTRSRHRYDMTDGRTLLIVDDDIAVSRTARSRDARPRLRSHAVSPTIEPRSTPRAQDSPELALVDLRLPGESGLAVVRDLKELDPSTVVVVLTGYGSIATAVESIKLGAASYLTKPADADQIVAAFDGAQPAEDAEVPSLARVEWEHIQRILADCGGNISQAARVLGIHRRSLQRKLTKYPASR